MKLNKFFILISLLLVLVVSMSMVSATEDISIDANEVVSITQINIEDNELTNDGNGEIHYTSEIYDEIKYWKTKEFNMKYDYYVDKTLIIYSGCKINGNGHTIYGNGKQAFDVKGLTIIGNLTFVNCSGSRGGAIYCHDANSFSVINCRFVNCSATNYGGAICSSEPNSFSVINCRFVNCSSKNMGGAIYVHHGDKGIIKNCIFDSCTGRSYGSTVYWETNQLSVSNCTFLNTQKKGFYFEGHGNEGTIDSKTYSLYRTIIDGKFKVLRQGSDIPSVEYDGFDNLNAYKVSKKSNSIPMSHTGTPLIALLIALISLPLIRRK